MKFGIHLPNFSPLTGREPTIRVATQAEALGFDSLWVSDHIVLPARVESQYPYGRPGVGLDPNVNYVDPLIMLAVAAGCTERVELGVTVLIVPLRDPLLTAKMLSSLDMLAGGRVVLAVGTGWMKEEFEALNLPYFDQRGKVTDEWIDIFRTCWREPLPSYRGQFYRFEPLHFEPKPTRPIPIWVGGNSPVAFRRAGRIGDGWQPARMKREEIGPAIEQVKRQAAAAGRDPDSLVFSMGCVLDVLPEDASARPPSRDLIGTPSALIEFIAELEALGMSHLALDFRHGSSVDEMLETMFRFRELVVRRL